MPEYRYNLLLSIRLSRIPWLEDPRTALNDEATSVLISEHVLAPNVQQQARNEEEDQYRNEARAAHKSLSDLYASEEGHTQVINLFDACY